MVSPVTGPFNRTTDYYGPTYIWPADNQVYREVWIRTSRTWYRQAKPYTKELPFYMQSQQVLGFQSSVPGDMISAVNSPTVNLAHTYLAANKAYSKFVGQLGESSQWGETLGQRKQGLAMIAKRCLQLRKLYKAVNQFDIEKIARELGVNLRSPGMQSVRRKYAPKTFNKPPRNVWNTKDRAKQVSDLWLELHFGWEPLVKDIYAAAKQWIDPLPPKRIKAKGFETTESHTRTSTGGGSGFVLEQVVTTSGVLYRGTISMNNPDLYTAQQFGLLNPLSIAWELVPFSFVVDWFTNVGQCLGAVTDLAGLHLDDPWSTTFQIITISSFSTSPGATRSSKRRSVYVSRVPGAISPTLVIKPFKGFSPVRGVTAIALLVQALKH